MAAPEVTLRDGNTKVKVRDPVITALLFFVPFYGLFWYYYINKELADLGRAKGTAELGDNPTTSVLALFPGGIIIVPAIISIWNAAGRVAAAQRITGVPGEHINQAIALLLMVIFSPVGGWWFQNELNRVWAIESDGAGAALPAAETAEPVAEPTPTESATPPSA